MTETKTDTRTEAKAAWDEVGSGCSQLGGTLKRHFAQLRDEDRSQAADALKKLFEAVGDAFEAVGNAARDPEVRTEARKVAGSLTEALSTTFAGVGGEVKKRFGKSDRSGEKPAPEGGAWAPPAGEPTEGGASSASHATSAPADEQLPD